MDEVVKGLIVLGSIGFIFSVVLSFLSEKFKTEENPLVEKILKVLPQINCGACGFSGCEEFARRIIEEKKLYPCIPGGEEVNKKIAQILGLKAEKIEAKKAVIRCGAKKEEKKVSFYYQGPSSCRAADILGGNIDCLYGCLGFGDCIEVCPQKAIYFDEGKIKIDIKKCIGCGKCVDVCPRNLISLIPYKEGVWYVACNNKDKGVETKKVCKVGCIGCGICARLKESPFFIKDNLSFIDYSRVDKREILLEAKNKCPVGCIVRND